MDNEDFEDQVRSIRFTGDSTLGHLLGSHATLILNGHYVASEHIEKAIHAFRVSEIEKIELLAKELADPLPTGNCE